ncbi:hypothetical protein NSE_0200 [Neorickettsia sennetsu str. Miyayama]|uniref:Uncharacterized protein n=1 Tax=Ehrlichia sennetsu (strain ATCC VR-367 / Miyayama) TaxID=222891 RepID=Q2GEK1_EHRS3|nr:hypothetical protein NSE_0200 [Neorickettsia sennetsu str. Miyayama]
MRNFFCNCFVSNVVLLIFLNRVSASFLLREVEYVIGAKGSRLTDCLKRKYFYLQRNFFGIKSILVRKFQESIHYLC